MGAKAWTVEDRIEQREGSSLSIREEEEKTIFSQEMDRIEQEEFLPSIKGEGDNPISSQGMGGQNGARENLPSIRGEKDNPIPSQGIDRKSYHSSERRRTTKCPANA